MTDDLTTEAATEDTETTGPQPRGLTRFPAHLVEKAREALAAAHAKVARAAARHGHPAPSAPILTVVKSYIEHRCLPCKRFFSEPTLVCPRCKSPTIERPLVDLDVTADRPRIAGWEFLAVVTPLDGGNLIARVPGAAPDVVLDAYRADGTGTRCDHCNAHRRRSETFIVRHEARTELLQVGRQCLASFLGGASPASIVARLEWASIVTEVGDESDDDEGGGFGSGGGARDVTTPATLLAWVAACVRLDGWRSRKVASEMDRPQSATATIAAGFIFPPYFGNDEQAAAEWRADRKAHEPTVEDTARAEAALTWARTELAPSGDYELNLQLLARQEFATHKGFGILASAIVAHGRVLGDEIKRRQRAANPGAASAHVGAIGDRVDLTVTVRVAFVRESERFGTSTFYVFDDEAGNVYTWGASGVGQAQVGESITIRGSVKAHEERNGVQQTRLTRCKVNPPAKPAKAPRARKAKAAKEPAGEPEATIAA